MPADQCGLLCQGWQCRDAMARVVGSNGGRDIQAGNQTLQSLTWGGFLMPLPRLAPDTLWRHNQAGDLPGQGDTIDHAALDALVHANKDKRGFTYTHKPLTIENALAIGDAANRGGLPQSICQPTICGMLTNWHRVCGIGPRCRCPSRRRPGQCRLATPEGRTVSSMPRDISRRLVSCKSCGLCQRQNRKTIAGLSGPWCQQA